jgi:hypothetical protein
MPASVLAQSWPSDTTNADLGCRAARRR